MSLNAFVTLITTDAYVPGALVTVHSVLEAEGAKPAHPFETVCLVTPASVSVESIKALRRNFSLVVGVEEIRSGSNAELKLLGRQDLASTLTKLHLFRLIQFRKVIFLDADTLCLQPLSHLFSLEAAFSAAPDSGWPDCFNSGMFVATPSAATFNGLMEMSAERGSWDGGDQGLLNDYFPDWNRLSFTYNVTPTAYYTYAPAYRRHGSGIKLVHFIGSHKPWHEPGPSRSQIASSEHPGSNDYASLVNKWFAVYQRYFSQGSSQTTFTFPTLQAIWDSPGNVTSYTPPSLEDLKKTFQGVYGNQQKGGLVQPGNHVAGNPIEGHYVSMPLQAGRPDLLNHIVFHPPKAPSPPKVPSPPQPSSPARVASPSLPTHHTTAAPAVVMHSKSPSPPPQQPRPWSPQLVNWDPARSEPPKQDRPQMEHGFDQQYDNVWDGPKSAPSSRAFFNAPSAYASIPKITHQNYDQVTQQHSPDAQKIKPVFPWEGQSRSNAPSRVFPREPQQPRRVPSPQNQPPPQPAMSSSAPVSTGFNTAGLASKYSNAWDSVASIKRYADTLQGKPRLGHSRSHSLNTAASTSHSQSHARTGSTASYYSGNKGGAASSPRKEGYETGGEASSRDGDDEDEDEEEDEDTGYARRNAAMKARQNQAAPPSNNGRGNGQQGVNRSPTGSLRGSAQVANRAIPPPHFVRPGGGMKRHDSFQNMANLTANVAAAGPVGPGPISPSISPSGNAAPSRAPLNRYASQRTSSSETVTPSNTAMKVGGLPDTSNGQYQSQRVSRVFDPATATDVIREEGLNALHRFVRNMETRGAEVRNGQTGANGNSSQGR